MSEYICTATLELLSGAAYSYERAVVRRRFKTEGAGFTAALELFAHTLMVALDRGVYKPSGAFKTKANSSLPKFFGAGLREIFADDGSIKPVPADVSSWVSIVRHIFQVCLAFKKFEAEPTEEMKEASYKGFLEIQDELKERHENGYYLSLYDHPVVPHARRFIRLALDGADFTTGSFGPGENLQGVNPQTLREHRIHPGSFVPGSRAFELASTIAIAQFRPAFFEALMTESRVFGSFDQPITYPALPANYFFLGDRNPKLRFQSMPCHNKRTAKMIAVPKTRFKARLIGKMHTDHVYVQSCIATGIRNNIRNTILDPVFPLLDQSRPSESAISNSMSGAMATLDLSAASDWVSCDLVRMLFPTEVWELLSDLRARRVSIKGRPDEYDTYSYGQMGDGTTFIVLSLVIGALCYGAMKCAFTPPPPGSIPLIVYGDDIQVPTEHAEAVIEVLEQFGLSVNSKKSYYHKPGYFRESCDGWGAFGHPVKPVWIKYLPDLKNPRSLASFLASARKLDERGYLNLAQEMYHLFETTVGFKLPYARDDDPYFGRFARHGLSTLAYIAQSGLRMVPTWRIRKHDFETSLCGDFFNAVRSPDQFSYWRDKKAAIRDLVGIKFQKVSKLDLVELPNGLPSIREYARRCYQLSKPVNRNVAIYCNAG